MLAAALGVFVGLVLALTGAGGAIIAVPLLVFALHWSVAQAGPVALLAVGASALAGALLGLRAGTVRYRAALLMAVSGSVVTPLGVLAAHRLPATPLSLIFAAVLAFVALRMFRQAGAGRDEDEGNPQAPCQLDHNTGRFSWTAPCARALSSAGLITGLLSGLLGVGGGFIIVPALRRSTDLPMNATIATSLMVIALVSASAVTVSALAGRLDFAVALPFAGGAVVAMLAGRMIAGRLAGRRLQQGFAIVAGAVAVGMAIHAIFLH